MASPPEDRPFESSNTKLPNEEPSYEEPATEEPLEREPYNEGLSDEDSSNKEPYSEESSGEELPEEKPSEETTPEEEPIEDKRAGVEQGTSDVPTKASQSDDVVTMYNVITKTIKAAKESAAQFQAIKDSTAAKMDALPINHLQRNKLKAASPRLVNITAALSLSVAHVMVMENFEKTFRSEWKHKKNESVALREVFLTAKTKEIEKIQRDYKMEMTKSLVGANMTILDLAGTGGADSSIRADASKGVATAEEPIESDAVVANEGVAKEKVATQDGVVGPAVEMLQVEDDE